ncbi:MAG: amino acid adenylation domain-containing protein, partial [bacterium]|nr:amino acid adenylation domain-containing protein [bacterium]
MSISFEERILLTAGKFIKQKEYWTEKLSGIGETAGTGIFVIGGMPVFGDIPTVEEHIHIPLAADDCGKLIQLGNRSELTIYVILAACLEALLYRYSGTEDTMVLSPVYEAAKTGDTMNNLLVVRNTITGETTFKQVLTEVGQSFKEACQNQDYPLDELLNSLFKDEPDTGNRILFQPLCILENIHGTGAAEVSRPVDQLVFSFGYSKEDEGIGGRILFNPHVYDSGFIQQVSRHYARIAGQLPDHIHRKVSTLPFLSGEETRQLIHQFNRTQADYPRDRTVHNLFEEQAEKTPDSIAVVYESKQVTYAQLNRQADGLALLLRQGGIGEDTIAAIMLERSLELLIGLLGILKAGGAYLPIDPGYPEERIHYMLSDSAAKVLVTGEEEAGEPGRSNIKEEIKKIYVDTLEYFSFSTSQPPDVSTSKSGSLAYVMYTSGSTGRPKGVMVEHRNVVRLVINTDHVPFTPGTRILQTGASVFDATTFEVWGTILNGGQLVLVHKNVILGAHRLGRALLDYQVNTLWLSSPLFNQLSREDHNIFATLHYLLVGGDVLYPPYINQARGTSKTLRVMNCYGPTENTVFSTTFWIEKDYEAPIPIGRPVTNSTAYIFDKNAALQPVGVFGELWTGGDGVARGYLNNPELTAEKFVSPPPFMHDSSLLYKTGDYARWLSDGNIEFSGRSDNQVKLRGFRIELGEIENQLMLHPGIKEAVVSSPVNREQEKYLAAYIVGDKDLTPAQVKEFLSDSLPQYMVPPYITILDRMPLAVSGKVDRAALPEPEVDTETGYQAPRDETEKELVKLWVDLLGGDAAQAAELRESIGIDDDFFARGGHSLKVGLLAAGIHRLFNVKMSLMELFERPTIKEISRFIKEAGRDEHISIEPSETKEYYPLSSAQRRLYILQQMEQMTTGYNLPALLILEGKVDRDRLERAFKFLVRRHESLRTSFTMIDHQPVQMVGEAVEPEIKYFDLAANRANEREEKDVNIIIEGFIRPFDLSNAPLLRVGLIKEEETKHILMVDLHHIISDGTSVGIMSRDFMALYGGRELPAQRLQYKDFSQWQGRRDQKEQLKQQETFWLKELSIQGEIPVINLPSDYPRPRVQRFEGSRLSFRMDRDGTKALQDYALREGVTLYMALLSIYFIFLSKVTGQEDIVVGTPTAGRNHTDLGSIIGMFINTLPLRHYPSGHQTVNRFMHQVKERTLTAFDHQDYMYEDLVEALVKERDAGRNPLFDTMFVLQNFQQTNLELPELTLKQYDFEWKTSKFDLTLEGMETEGHLSFTFEYGTGLFKESTIERFARYFIKIIAVVLQSPGMEISAIEFISEDEKKQVLYDFNDTRTDYPRDKTVNELFEEQVNKSPDAIAVVGMDHRSGLSVSYKELHHRSNGLALELIKKGIKPGTDSIVAVMMNRSPELIVAVLGILKAGAAYLPIDLDWPEERVDYMLRDSGAGILLLAPWKRTPSTAPLNEVPQPPLSRGEFSSVQIMELPGIFNSPLERGTLRNEGGGVSNAAGYSNLAYIIYTSGSTGNPKGVMVDHRNIVRLVCQTDYMEFKPGEKILQTGALSFDASTFEIWNSLLNGIGLYLMSKEDILSPHRLKWGIINFGITIMWMTAPLFNQMLDEDIEIFSGLRNFLVGGDVLSPPHINRLRERFPQLNIINVYGPTENTTFSTSHLIPEEYNGPIPIGKPIDNSTAYILDGNNQPQPVGVVGELCVGGDGVSRGYLNNPELTNEKFEVRSSKFALYHTGDLAKWRSDGVIEFLGRVDAQVKVRGFRIELEEIENRLKRLNGVIDAVVIAREGVSGGSGDKSLCAYVVTSGEVDVSAIREELSTHLPDFMVPSYFIELEKIPLTLNGKVDRRALPEPESVSGETYQAPRDDTETRMVGLWAEVLGRDDAHVSQLRASIGINDDFFQLGGHSLKAVLLNSRIHQAFNVKVPLAEIFGNPTIARLSCYVRESAGDFHISLEPVEEKDYYPLSSAQRRLYLLQGMDETGTGYNIPAMFMLEGRADRGRLEDAFKGLIKRHESLRTSFHMTDNQPVQRVYDHVDFEIEGLGRGDPLWSPLHGNHSSLNRNNPGQGSHRGLPLHLQRDFVRPFDLSRAPLLRVGLMTEEETKHLLMVDMHHIISDGTSVSIMVKDFMALYAGEELPAQRLQYKDFSQWQGRQDQKEQLKQQETYWLNEFSVQGEIPVLDLQTDYERPSIQGFEGDRLKFKLPGETRTALVKSASENGATLYMVLLSIFTILLAKLSGQEDIIVGTPIAGRRHTDLDDIIGMFVNTLALRNFPTGQKPFGQFLEEVKKRTLNSFENQDYQYEDLVENVVVEKDTSRNPLFDTMLALQNLDIREARIPGLTLTPVPFESRIAKFDLMLECIEMDDHLSCNLDYSTRLFKKETVQRLTGYVKKTILSVTGSHDIKISRIEIIPEEEKQQLLVDFNDTAAEYPKAKTLHRLFEEQAEKKPHHIAVTGNRGSLTYAELNNQSGHLARHLKEKGVGPDTIAAVMVERSLEMLIGIYGILKAGGAYLPIDPDYPEERIRFMQEDSGVKIIVTNGLKVEGLDGLKVMETKTTPRDSNEFPNQQTNKLTNQPTNLAYLIYTSGSTGKPKGVAVEHRSAVNTVTALFKKYPFSPSDTYLLKTSYIFDVSVSELFGWFLGGGRLAVLEPGGEMEPQKIVDAIEYEGVTHINFVPSMFSVFLEVLKPGYKKTLSPLKYIFAAGEAFLPALVEKFNRMDLGIILENLYGPTEAAVYASSYSLGQWEGAGSIPIGKPLANTKLYILDRYRHLCPLGTVGQLYISGPGVARGYLNKPGLTMAQFAPNPFADGERMYCTGDLVKWRSDGDIEFLGRSDHQVKIRGFRIELGEIENRLLQHEAIKEVVVTAKEDETGNKYLCAYLVTLTGEGGPDFKMDPGKALKDYLSDILPDYMIPSYFTELDNLPLTGSGKVNRKALPHPQLKAGDQYRGPRDYIESQLVELWASLLAIQKETIGIDDNFFQLGGNSLTATLLVSQVSKAFDVNITLGEIFQTPSIHGLADKIRKTTEEKFISLEPVETKEYYSLSSSQRRLYLLQQMDRESIGYNLPVLLQIVGDLDVGKIESVFHQLVRRHESLRTSFHMEEEKLVQRVHQEVTFELEYLSATPVIIEHGPTRTDTEIIKDFVRFFDLSHVPLLRAGLLERDANNYLLVVDIHHIISDGISIQVLINDFTRLYASENFPLPRLQYKDFSQWQNSTAREDVIKQQEAYWINQFEGEIPVLNLPADYPRPQVRSFEGETIRFQVGGLEYDLLKSLSRTGEATLYMVLLSIFTILLSKLSGQEDIVVGTPIAGRRHADLENIIGMFVNTMALRNFPTGQTPFSQFLEEVKKQTLSSFENQDYQYEDLVENLVVNRDTSRNPLFDTMLILQNLENREMRIPGLTLKQLPSKSDIAKFDLTLECFEIDDYLSCSFEYSTRLFKHETIQRFIGYFMTIIPSLSVSHDIKISEIEIIAEEEKQQLLVDFNDTASEYLKDKTIHRLFEEQFEKKPGHCALTGKTTNENGVSITYSELNRRADELARELNET